MTIIETRNKLITKAYKGIVRSILFQFDAEWVHNLFIKFGKMLGSNRISKKKINLLFDYQNPTLKQNVLGIEFRNPVGLAAGFDKNAEMISIMEDVGFGFTEVGSITALSCKGNPGKRMSRLIEKKALWINLGLNNLGAGRIFQRLRGKKYAIPYGVSIAKTNCKETADSDIGIKDYIRGIEESLKYNVGNYITINISCPNAYGGQPFHKPELLEKLMKKVEGLNVRKPIFLKLSPDIDRSDLDRIIKIAEKYKVSGFITSNLTKETGTHGGYSGKIVEGKANQQLAYLYKKTKGKFVLIGCGGIFSAEDAYRKIKLGASLVQLVTGMIYEGPSLIGDINLGIVRLLKKDGYGNIGEAVGKGLR